MKMYAGYAEQLIREAKPLIQALTDPKSVNEYYATAFCPYCGHVQNRAIAKENKHEPTCPVKLGREWLEAVG